MAMGPAPLDAVIIYVALGQSPYPYIGSIPCLYVIKKKKNYGNGIVRPINAAAWLVTFAVLLLLGRHLGRHRHYNLPLGTRRWPIIGNLNLIGPLPHRSIHALSQKYGPIMHVWFGSNPVVVGPSAEIAIEFLKTQDATLASRPKFAAGKYTAYNYSDITWSQYGPYWRQPRRMFLTELFNPKRIESYEYIIREELKVFLRELYNPANKTIA